jgi:hypothetical protein
VKNELGFWRKIDSKTKALPDSGSAKLSSLE